MVPRSTPDSRIHTSSVAPDSASGRPDEKPRNITISTRGFRYTASASRNDGRAALSPSPLWGGPARFCAPGWGSFERSLTTPPPDPSPQGGGEPRPLRGARRGSHSLSRPELTRHRRGDDLRGRWVFVVINFLNLLPAT